MKSSKKEVIKFAALIAFVMLVISGIGWYKGRDWWPYSLGGGALFLSIGLIATPLIEPVYRGWMAMARVMAWVNTRLLLSIVFIFIITPTAIIMRLFGKDVIEAKINAEANTYLNDRDQAERAPEDYQRMF